MEIVIDIPEEKYEYINVLNDGITDYQTTLLLYLAVRNGTPLPKGHGNFIQREDAEDIFKNARKSLYELSRKEQIKDFQTREMMLLNAEQFVHLIQPIIEADRGE